MSLTSFSSLIAILDQMVSRPVMLTVNTLYVGCLISVGERRKLERGPETALLLRPRAPQTQLNPCAGRGHRVCGCRYRCHDPTNRSRRIRILHCHQHCPSYAHRHGQRSSPLARCWYVQNSPSPTIFTQNISLDSTKCIFT